MNWLLVFTGGGLGSLLRYGTSAVINRWWQHSLPMATLVSNIAACLILGITLGLLRERMQSGNDLWYTFMVIGVCGGYSTFSTFARENLDLFEKGNYAVGILNIALSMGLCLLAVYVGKKA